MATVVSTVLTFRGQAGNIDQSGEAGYAEIYQVKMSDVNGTGLEALIGNVDIPALGVQFDATNYPSIVVTGYGFRKYDRDPVYFDITVLYGTPKNKIEDTIFPPTDRPVRRGGGCTIEEKPTLLDANGDPIFMSNGRPPSKPVTKTKVNAKSKLSKWYDDTFTFATVAPYVGKVNSGTYDGAAAETLKLIDVTWRQESMSNGAGSIEQYYDVTYEFEYDPDGFNDEEFASNDIYELREWPTGGGIYKLFRIKDQAGRDISSPYFLDSDGVGITPTELITGSKVPHTFTVSRYNTVNFDALGII